MARADSPGTARAGGVRFPLAVLPSLLGAGQLGTQEVARRHLAERHPDGSDLASEVLEV
jgi:hypothetical protein